MFENNLELCDCLCHTNETMRHVVPCCSQCKYCEKNIKIPFFAGHLAECRKTTVEKEFKLIRENLNKNVEVVHFSTKHCDKDKNPINLTCKGELTEFIPYIGIKIKENEACSQLLCFIGPLGGILSVKDENGNTLYANEKFIIKTESIEERTESVNKAIREKFGEGYEIDL
jgi:hypothetical protein